MLCAGRLHVPHQLDNKYNRKFCPILYMLMQNPLPPYKIISQSFDHFYLFIILKINHVIYV